jgi:hypothetical protein
MIRKLFYVFFISILSISVGCKSSKTLLQTGEYDAAVRKSALKLQKNSTNTTELTVLQEAFPKAQQYDLDKIIYLKKSGQPTIWDEILDIYTNMKSRQELVKTLRNLPFTTNYVNCDDEIIQARNNAANYYYTHAALLLKNGERPNARAAYNEFQKVKSYFTVYKDVDTQIAIAHEEGTSKVLFKLRNRSGIPLPPQLENDLVRMNVQDLDTKWIRYYNNEQQGLIFDYIILADMKLIDISPESIKESRYTETADVEGGYDYKTDSRGNVMKDAKGNDIKTPKYKTIYCDILETNQRKTAHIAGTIDYINNANNQIIRSSPIAADAFFEHYAADARGNLDALTQQSRAKLGGAPVPFPSNADIMIQAGVILKKVVKDIVWNNCELLN